MNREWGFLRELKNFIMPSQYKEEEYISEIRKAREEWLAAQNYFENVVDHALVDYAIYELEAARRKYVYMLKQAETKGITSDKFINNANI